MSDDVQLTAYYLYPGHVCLPAGPSRLCGVVASGIAVTMFDTKRKFGGMSHYFRPNRQSHPSTAIFAAPAIVALVRMFQAQGSSTGDIEAHLFGGAINPHSLTYVEGLSEQNVKVGLEVLGKLDICIAGRDVGGSRPRKIVFNTRTGETLVAKVDRVRETDWYPEMNAVAGFRRE